MRKKIDSELGDFKSICFLILKVYVNLTRF